MDTVPSEVLSRVFVWSDPVKFEIVSHHFHMIANDEWNIKQYVSRVMQTLDILEVDVLAMTPWLYRSLKRFLVWLRAFADRLTFLEFEFVSVMLTKNLQFKNVGPNLRTLWTFTELHFGEFHTSHLMTRTTVQTLRNLRAHWSHPQKVGESLMKRYCETRLIDFNRLPRVALRNIHTSAVLLALQNGHNDMMVHILKTACLNWSQKDWEYVIEYVLNVEWTDANTLLATQVLQAILCRSQSDSCASVMQTYRKITITMGRDLPTIVRNHLDAFANRPLLEEDHDAVKLRYALRHNVTEGPYGIPLLVAGASSLTSIMLKVPDMRAIQSPSVSTRTWDVYIQALHARGEQLSHAQVRYLIENVSLIPDDDRSFCLLRTLLDVCFDRHIDFSSIPMCISLMDRYWHDVLWRDNLEVVLAAYWKNRFLMRGPMSYVQLFQIAWKKHEGNPLRRRMKLELALKWLPDPQYADIITSHLRD